MVYEILVSLLFVGSLISKKIFNSEKSLLGLQELYFI